MKYSPSNKYRLSVYFIGIYSFSLRILNIQINYKQHARSVLKTIEDSNLIIIINHQMESINRLICLPSKNINKYYWRFAIILFWTDLKHIKSHTQLHLKTKQKNVCSLKWIPIFQSDFLFLFNNPDIIQSKFSFIALTKNTHTHRNLENFSMLEGIHRISQHEFYNAFLRRRPHNWHFRV